MPIVIERRDYEFLLLSENFCSKIDLYAPVLGINDERLEVYKTNNLILTHVFNNATAFGSCVESFTRVKIQELRSDFEYLQHLCKTSGMYNRAIGIELGIEDMLFVPGLN